MDQLNSWTTVIRVFDSPRNTFEHLLKNPSILPPYVASTLVGGVSAAISLPVTLRLMELEFAATGTDMLAAMGAVRVWILIGGVFGAVLGPLVTGFFVAALIFGIVLFLGYRVTFRPLFSMVGHARLILTIATLVQALITTLAIDLTEMRSVSVSPSVFAPIGTAPPMISVLSTLGPFYMWYLFLLMVVVSVATRKPLWRSWLPAIVLYTLSLLFTILGSGLTDAPLMG